MHRRPLGRGRLLVLIGSGIAIVACFLPWFSIGGGTGELPLTQSLGLGGSGILTFLAAIGGLAVVSLPYAAGGRPVGLDRTLIYALLTGVAVVGLLVWPIEFVMASAAAGLLPAAAPGFWLASGGTIIMARGTYEIGREPPRL